jgi:hypothetical protein
MTKEFLSEKESDPEPPFAVLDCFAVRACGPGTGLGATVFTSRCRNDAALR